METVKQIQNLETTYNSLQVNNNHSIFLNFTADKIKNIVDKNNKLLIELETTVSDIRDIYKKEPKSDSSALHFTFLFLGIFFLMVYLITNTIVFVFFAIGTAVLYIATFIIKFLFGDSYVSFNEGLSCAHALNKEGWLFSTSDGYNTCDQWSKEYGFFHQGDCDDCIDIKIFGTYKGHEFTYFEYSYTIIEEVEEEVENDDGEIEIECHEEEHYYSRSGFFVKTKIETVDDFVLTNQMNTNGLNFSHIEFENNFNLTGSNKVNIFKTFSPKKRLDLIKLKSSTKLNNISFVSYFKGTIFSTLNTSGFFIGSVNLKELSFYDPVPYLKTELDKLIRLTNTIKE